MLLCTKRSERSRTTNTKQTAVTVVPLRGVTINNCLCWLAALRGFTPELLCLRSQAECVQERLKRVVRITRAPTNGGGCLHTLHVGVHPSATGS